MAKYYGRIHKRIPLLFAFRDLFLVVLSGHGVVAEKKLALLEEFDLLEMVHCPSIIAVFAGPY